MKRLLSRHYFPDFLSLLVIFLTIVFAYMPLLYPDIKIFITPDRYLSDILHFNLPLKHLLAESLRNGTWPPVWTNLIGTGFPLVAEAEIGAFSIINIVLFGLFDEALAFTLTSLTSSLLIAFSSFAIARMITRSRMSAIFFAVAYTFTGFLTVQIAHQNHLQTLAFMLAYFAVLLYSVKHTESRIRFLIPLIFSQAIFAGHYQYVFMGGITLFLIWLLYFRSIVPKKTQFTLLVLTSIGVLISAIQIIPTTEFFLLTKRLTYDPASANHMTLGHLKQLVAPFAMGDIRNGSFPLFTLNASYWETLPYVGTVPFIFWVVSIFLSFHYKALRFFLSMTVILFLLAFEQASPLYVIFSLPPFSFFRMHSRFIAFGVFFLLLGSMFAVQVLLKKFLRAASFLPFLIGGILISACSIELITFFRSYNPTEKATVVYKKPDIFSTLSSSDRVLALQPAISWAALQKKTGWRDMHKYLYLLGDGTPNSTMLWNIANAHIYSGFSLSKQTSILSLFYQEISDNPETGTTKLTNVGHKFLDFMGVTHLISIYETHDPSLMLVDYQEPPSDDLPSLYLYKRKVPSHISLTDTAVIAHSIENIVEHLKKTEENANVSYLSDRRESGTLICKSTIKSSVKQLQDSQTRVTFAIATPCDTYAVIQTYFYPGWRAYIDGKAVPIVPANIISMGIKIPEGDHILSIAFISQSFLYGGVITLAGIALYLLSIIIGARSQDESYDTHVPYARPKNGTSRIHRKNRDTTG